MHVETITRAVCDVCGATGPEALAGENAQELAVNRGWVYHDAVDETVCASCNSYALHASDT